MVEWVMGGVLAAVALVATWSDVRQRRIPNAVTLPALGIALGLRGLGGFAELGMGLAGAGICFLFAIPFFLAGGFGGGDVKLMTAFGAFLGPDRLLAGLVVMAFVGGAMAMVEMVRRGAVARTFWNLYLMFNTLGRRTFTGWKKGASEAWVTLDTPGAITVPYGLAISSGALFAWFF